MDGESREPRWVTFQFVADDGQTSSHEWKCWLYRDRKLAAWELRRLWLTLRPGEAAQAEAHRKRSKLVEA
jgi:hypothetical protein